MATNTASTDTATTTNCRECGTLENVKFKRFIPKDKKIPDLCYLICEQCDVGVEFSAAETSDEAIKVWNDRQKQNA